MKIGASTEVDGVECPICHFKFSTLDHLAYDDPAKNEGREAVPMDGDYTLCGDCGMILRFTEKASKLSVRLATPEELETLQQTIGETYSQFVQLSLLVKAGIFKSRPVSQ